MTTKIYKVKTSPLFEKEFSKLDCNVQRMVALYIKNNLDGCTNPRVRGKALKGNMGGLWRYRISDYRLIAEIRDQELIILALNIGHRKSIYRK